MYQGCIAKTCVEAPAVSWHGCERRTSRRDTRISSYEEWAAYTGNPFLIRATTPLVDERPKHSQSLCGFISQPIDMNRPGEPCNLPLTALSSIQWQPCFLLFGLFYEMVRSNLTRTPSPNKHSIQYLASVLFLSSLRMGPKRYAETSYYCYNITPCYNAK